MWSYKFNFCRNTLVVSNYKTEFNAKGQLIDKLDDGQLKGEFDLTLPTGHHFTGKVSSAGILCLVVRYVFKVAVRTDRLMDISLLYEASSDQTCLGILLGEQAELIKAIHCKCSGGHPLRHQSISPLCKEFFGLLLGWLHQCVLDIFMWLISLAVWCLKFLAFAAMQLRYGFFWVMVTCHLVIGTPSFKTTMLSLKCQAPVTQWHGTICQKNKDLNPMLLSWGAETHGYLMWMVWTGWRMVQNGAL